VGDARFAFTNVSYGYQVSTGNFGRANAKVHNMMPLAADQGPVSAAAIGSKTPSPKDFLDATITDNNSANLPPDDWRPLNSPNHGGYWDGEGQNVVYEDAKVEWKARPRSGVLEDNIYTAWENAIGKELWHRAAGISPMDNGQQTPQSDTDTLVYP